MRRPRTHFQQISVEEVKKIAKIFAETNAIGHDHANAGQGAVTPPQLTIMKAEYPWQELYEAAILETDNAKLQQHLPAAKAAVDARVRELQVGSRGTPEERQAIHDALTGLNVLRKELQARAHETSLSKD